MRHLLLLQELSCVSDLLESDRQPLMRGFVLLICCDSLTVFFPLIFEIDKVCLFLLLGLLVRVAEVAGVLDVALL